MIKRLGCEATVPKKTKTKINEQKQKSKWKKNNNNKTSEVSKLVIH